MSTYQQTVVKIVREVAESRDIQVRSIEPHHALVEDIGLASLDLAQLIAELQFETGLDPFRSFLPITDVRTVDDLCRAYDSYQTWLHDCEVSGKCPSSSAMRSEADSNSSRRRNSDVASSLRELRNGACPGKTV